MSAMDTPTPDFLLLSEAAKRLKVSPKTLRRWADANRVPVFVTPTGWRRFRVDDIDRLAAELGVAS